MTRCSTGRATQKYRGNGTDLSDILETPGDIIYADAAVSAENLVISGTTGDVLKVSASGIPEWGTSTSQWITSGDDISYSLGHVGIGTTSPDANLHVTGNAFVSTDLGLGGTLTMGNVLVEALHELSAITATGNVTPHVIEFTNPTTGLVTTGNVGIKTSTPLQTLEVNGSVGIKHDGVGGYTFHTSTGAMRAGIHSSAGNHILFKAGANNERMRLLASGELGIGTSTPSKPLTVDGDVHIPSGSDANSGSFPQNSVTRSIYFGGISQSGSMYQSKTAIVSAPWTQYGGTQSWGRHGLHFCVDSVADNGNVELGQTKMCINYLGNVGIGSWSTSNPLPQTMASVHGGRVLEGRDASGFEFMAASSDTTNANGQFNGAFLIKNMDTDGSEPHYVGMAGRGNSTNGSMDLLFYSGRDNYENNTPQMVIDPDGNVGIGTSTPGYTLDVTGDINFTGNLIQNGSAYGSSPWTTTGNDISYTTGRVGVGTISPDANLHVEGNVYMSSNLEVGGATISRTVSYDVPSVSWATSIGGTNSDYGYGIATDSNGNVYVIGKYSGTVTIGSTTLNSAGSSDAFVAKYDTSGTVQWAKSIGGTSSDAGQAIATDSNGNVYVIGFYNNTATFAPGTTLTTAGYTDTFVAKYDTSGTVQWAESIGGTYFDYGQAIATDSAGNVYVTGYYNGSVTIGTITLTSTGSNDIFVAKYNTSGTVQWAKSIGGTDTDYGYGIATDSNGNVYVIGFYDNTVTFAPGTTLNSTGGDDAFVAKYDTSGTVQWAKSIGGTSSDNGRGIATDSNGNVYVTGKYSTTATFAPGTTLTSVGSSDAFVAKYNTSGTVQWAMSIGGTSSDYGQAIATDSAGNVYVTGYYSGSVTIGSTTLNSAGSTDAFVAKYNTSGTVQWAMSIGGTSPDYGYGIATDSGGNVYVTGYYRGSVTIGSTTLNSVGGSNDTFVVKYSPPIALHINKSVDVTGDINFTGNLTQNGSAYGGGGSGSSLWTESSGDIQRSSGNVEVGVANLFVNTTTSRVGVGTVSPSVELHVSGTGAIIVPSGTTAERPATGVTGMIRFNNTTYKYEGWGMISWVDLSIADPPGLYSFTSHTFTSCGGDSRYGPQLSDALATYGNISPWNDINLFNIAIRGFQLWTVPETGTYRITARGARGGEESSSAGSYNNTPGSGGAVRADIALTVNTQVVFIVGQTPPQSTGNYRSGSGGGATWVLKPGGGYTNNNDVYMVAGGGGGAGPRHYNSGTAGHADASSQGTLGGGGTTHWNSNGGGAGWTSDGYPNGFRGGVRPAGGAMGGTGTTHGGFGGGGSESGDSAGGGAGAKGGRAALRYDSTGSDTARGGTSYITTNATNRTFLGNHGLTNNGNVYVELLP